MIYINNNDIKHIDLVITIGGQELELYAFGFPELLTNSEFYHVRHLYFGQLHSNTMRLIFYHYSNLNQRFGK
jgi:hypothetical protein